jgi:predicted HAD superfamily phosphohydrolase
MAISQDEYKLRVETRETLLNRIKERSEGATEEQLKHLAEAFSLLVETEAPPRKGPSVASA